MKTNKILFIATLIMLAFIAVLLIKTRQLSQVSTIPTSQNGEETILDDEGYNIEEAPLLMPSGDISLKLNGQELDKLPAYVLNRTDLEVLDISNNNLTGALPAEIKNLKRLKILNAANNQMTGIPAEVGQLDRLEVLDLSNNRITGLPLELGNLKNLKILNLSGNNYSKADLETIKRTLPADVVYLLQ